MGDAANVQLPISPEASYGTVPDDFRQIRITSEDLRLDRSSTESREIDPTRQPAGSVPTSKSVSGGFDTELSLVAPAAGDAGFDLLYRLAMMNVWSTIVSLDSQSIDLSAVSNDQVLVTDQATSGAFTNVVEGQWIKMSGFDVNGTVYFHVVSKVSNDSIACEGVRSTGAVTVAEAGQTDISIRASMLRIGSSKESFAAERAYTDLSPIERTYMGGLWIDSWQRTVTPEALLVERFGVRGKTHDTEDTGSLIVTTPDSKWATPRLNAVDDVALVFEGVFASVASTRATRIAHTLNNRSRVDIAIGEDGPIGVGLGIPTFNGEFNAFMTSGALMRKYEDRTVSKFAYLLDDGTNQQMVTAKQVVYTQASAPARDNTSAVEVAAQFAAEPDATGVAVQIDRFGA